ncbi:Phosphoribosyl 1,2-cyclic phosphodiesterase [Kandleria vitulina]|jgi:phosphoribosyl 1,2-cyclic phosphodiesterase|uniref:Beta-lactamase domain-containing protein n=2 Tax=Kandleria vitulina TaxID=1630 RepID=A0A0R2HEB7_9FIRM|nr:MBL fold metallo-hydrolase [Kandleria vitulina]KRN51392.1 beta-lactamase domain-containing protein [Kandleria vitulina DSM 20405]SDW54391.1 Phosphoribosyl 1,2-cyclic phosphodiesterase [Kandleria vitulina]SEJ20527.1 Phosphoribosyl 1,2-cyclic phosphodiesterase [Kandleria vitulina]
MEFHVLASGSKGNATFVYENGTGILIDCGISRKQLLYRLNEVGFNESDITYVFLTHDHYDHSKNIHIFEDKMIYSARGNIEKMDEEHILEPFQTYHFNQLSVEVLPLSHDATNTVGFVIRGDESLLYMTDTGFVSVKNRELIGNLNYYIIEANHDIEMLMNTRRPLYLKNRILGDEGHLCNEYSARLMCEVIGEDTKEIVLAHLSQEANTKELALKTYYEVFDEKHMSFDRNNIKVASQVDVVSGGKYEH